MKILVTHKIPEEGLQIIRKNDIEMDILKGKVGKSDIIKALKKHPYDGMVTLLTDTIDSDVLNSVGSNMQIVSNYAVGFNNIDLESAKKLGLRVSNTPGVLTDTVAEHTVTLILSVAKHIVEADSFTRAKKFKGWEPELFLGIDLKGKTLGILGAGRIGSRVAEILKTFGMDIIYYDIKQNQHIEKTLSAKRCLSPEDVLKNSDVLSVHLLLNESTHHFLDGKKLSLMKPNSIIVNTSRGPIIEESELVKVLKAGRIFGAGIDVFENEPKISSALRKLPNVILTPHTASASISTRNKMSKIVGENIVAVLHGGEPTTPVV